MVKYSCHIHLTDTLRDLGEPPHYMLQVAPAGAGETCDHGSLQRSKGFGKGLSRWYGGCGKPALWAVNPA